MYLLRHCESYFNLLIRQTKRDPGIQDPELTPAGHAHAEEIAAQLDDIALTSVVISPYTRALQTAQPILKGRSAPARISADVRERTAFVCDIGSHPAELAARFPHHDFSHLPGHWWHKDTESAAETEARAGAFRMQMRTQPDEGTTLIVTHWAFIMALTGKSVANGEILRFDPHAAPPLEIDWKY